MLDFLEADDSLCWYIKSNRVSECLRVTFVHRLVVCCDDYLVGSVHEHLLWGLCFWTEKLAPTD